MSAGEKPSCCGGHGPAEPTGLVPAGSGSSTPAPGTPRWVIVVLVLVVLGGVGSWMLLSAGSRGERRLDTVGGTLKDVPAAEAGIRPQEDFDEPETGTGTTGHQ